MSNRTDIVVETDNAEGQVLLSASRVYDLTEDKTQDTINSEVKSTLTQLGTATAVTLPTLPTIYKWASGSSLYKYGKLIIGNFGISIRAGSYDNNEVITTGMPAVAYGTIPIMAVSLSGTAVPLNITSQGALRFDAATTTTANAVYVANIVYVTN